MMVDANFAEFINDDSNPPAVLSSQYTVQQCCLAGAKKSGQHGYWNSFIICFGHRLEILSQLFCKGNTHLGRVNFDAIKYALGTYGTLGVHKEGKL